MFERLQKQEDPRRDGRQKDIWQERRQQVEEEHSYGTGVLGYTREDEPNTDVVQRYVWISENAELDPEEEDSYVFTSVKDFENEYSPELEGFYAECEREGISTQSVRAILRELVEDSQPPTGVDGYGEYQWKKVRLDEDTKKKYAEFYEEFMQSNPDTEITIEEIYSHAEKEVVAGAFEWMPDFLQYLLSRIKARNQEEEKDTQNDISAAQASEQMRQRIAAARRGMVLPQSGRRIVGESEMKGAYARFSTIYSYGMVRNGNKVKNLQGPHRLAHSSVSFLMNRAPEGYDFFESQVPDPEEVKKILVKLGIDPNNKLLKASRYITDYTNKYNELVSLIQETEAIKYKPNALLRELMEMHPMAVYGWKNNLNKSHSVKAHEAPSGATKGGKERIGNKIFLDLGTRYEPIVHGTPEYEELYNYLRMRLSMAVGDKDLDKAIKKLMSTGEADVSIYERRKLEN